MVVTGIWRVVPESFPRSRGKRQLDPDPRVVRLHGFVSTQQSPTTASCVSPIRPFFMAQ